MDEKGSGYDLEERSFEFALAIRKCIASSKWTREQWTDVDQLLRSSGSVAANYTEANNAVSKPDFLLRIRIAKKESSECKLWLRLLGSTAAKESIKSTLRTLFKEADELTRILPLSSAIHRNNVFPFVSNLVLKI